MSTACLQHVYSMSTACLQHVYSMSTACLQHVYSMSTACLRYGITLVYGDVDHCSEMRGYSIS